MRRYLTATCIAMIASILLAPAVVKADSFTFTISGTGVNANGQSDSEVLTAAISGSISGSPSASGGYSIDSITGTVTTNIVPSILNSTGATVSTGSTASSAMTGLATFDGDDNELYPNANTNPGDLFVSGDGISFLAGGVYYNLFDRNGSYVLDADSQGATAGLVVTDTPVSVNAAEPSSFLLLAAGFAGLMFVFRRKLQLG